ncbi:hypothetical protein RhiirA4_481236 [Rhizophagus irregularis]|uniref:Uncharacterized protein n=1 Tax=Rhizophagus irregularis TaxID=588596 RepID=A0A2I1HJ86_9GLOM|nr:hypothetical protein RhiirA4_481236 [Rhizophagus irregularis]
MVFIKFVLIVVIYERIIIKEEEMADREIEDLNLLVIEGKEDGIQHFKVKAELIEENFNSYNIFNELK